MFVGDDEVTGRTSRDRGWRPANDPSYPPAFPSKEVMILARTLFLAVAVEANDFAVPRREHDSLKRMVIKKRADDTGVANIGSGIINVVGDPNAGSTNGTTSTNTTTTGTDGTNSTQTSDTVRWLSQCSELAG